jgi:hypothetical protein
MLYVGALLIVHGRYTFAQMLQVFTLIIFTITFSGQLMTYRSCSSLFSFQPSSRSNLLRSQSLP